jgi:DNA-binding NarL/FixJ family response regulator
MENTIRILLADDHPLVRAGIRSTLGSEPQIQLVGEATDAREAQRMSQDLKPDVLLLDLNMPGPLPIETVSFLRLHCPAVIILVLSAHDDDIYVRNLIAAGASGYVLKDEAPETVIQAIQTVVQGGSWFSRSVVNKLFHLKRENRPYITEENLTEREQQLIGMVAQGWNNARIAIELHLAEQTVRNYMSHLYIKLNIQSRGEAIVWARERGLTNYP